MLRTQACHAACYHGIVFVVKWVLRRSALLLVQPLLPFFVIALIFTSYASTLLVRRNHPTFDIIAVQDQQLAGQQQ